MCTYHSACHVENAKSRLIVINQTMNSMWRPVWYAALLLLPKLVVGLCPSLCSCNDIDLEAACVNASLEVVPIQLNPDAKVMNLRENKIVKLLYTFRFYPDLRALDLSQNRLASLGNENFISQSELLTLNLSRNLISNLTKDSFKGLRKLRVLDMSENQLESLEGGAFSNLPNLVELYVVNNRILDIGHYVFEKLNALVILKLDENQLLDIPTVCLKYLQNLEYIGLGGNLIKTIEQNTTLVMSYLKTLVLRGNVILDIDRGAFSGLSSLEHLDLSDNNLTFVPTESLSKLKNLTYLDLSGNSFSQIKPVAFQSLFKLQGVKLSRLENLYKIDGRAFVDNINLERVEMDGNIMLPMLPWRLFHGNPLVSEVSIRNNGLTSLDVSHFPLDQLRSLSLGGNPLNCNCSLLWLWMLERQQDEEANKNTSIREVLPLLDVSSIRCATPEEWESTLLINVPESDVQCDNSFLAAVLVAAALSFLSLVVCILGYVRCRTKVERTVETIETPRVMHEKGNVMVLLGQEDSLDNFVLRTNKELSRNVNEVHPFPTRELEHEDSAMRLYSGQYPVSSSINKPNHVVFV